MTILHPHPNLQKLELEHRQLEQHILWSLQHSSNTDDGKLYHLLLQTPPQLWPESLSRYCPSFVATARHRLEKVQAAISQIKLGIYGVCADCEAQIEAERLACDPATQRCKVCAAKAQDIPPALPS